MGVTRALLISIFVTLTVGQSLAAMDKVVCYYGTWGTYRNGNGRVAIDDIDPNLCTHIIYSFVGLQTNGEIKLLDAWLDLNMGGFNSFNQLKLRNPNLKTLLAIGGWNEGSSLYSQIASSASTRKVLIDSAVHYLQQFNFDGFDLDWEYPGQRGGNYATDKGNFVALVREMREEFDKYGFIVTAAVGVTKSSSSISYDIPELTKYLTFINLMTYDLHGAWDPYLGGNAPLYRGSWETTASQQELNIDAVITSWIERGAKPEKLVLGIGFYGVSFTMLNPANNKPNSPARGVGNQGPYTQQPGFLGYNELCEQMKLGGWTTVIDPEQKFSYSYKGDQWVGYDNEESIALKIAYAKSKGLGGAMIWSIETDDTKGVCGEKWPLLKKIRSEMGIGEGTPNPTTAAPTTAAPTTAAPTTALPTTPQPGQSTTAAPTTTAKPTTVTPGVDYPNSLCSKEGFIRDPYVCSFFYYCQFYNGKYTALKYTCSAGLVYNENLVACDYPRNVPECDN